MVSFSFLEFLASSLLVEPERKVQQRFDWTSIILESPLMLTVCSKSEVHDCQGKPRKRRGLFLWPTSYKGRNECVYQPGPGNSIGHNLPLSW